MRKSTRSFLLALLLCCIAVIAMAGIYRREFGTQESTVDDLVKLEEGQDDAVPDEEEVAAIIEAAGLAETESAEETDEAGAEAAASDTTGEEAVQDVPDNTVYAQETISGTVASDLNFQASSVLVWPVQGEVLMEYSMEQPVYYATLEQYRTSDGILIQSEEGTMVYAGADGCVAQIAESDALGCTVTLDLGNGYSVTYGQLKSLNVSEGDMVSTGTVLGLVAAPTKYYCVEGAHVYLRLDKDGEAVDPLDYLD